MSTKPTLSRYLDAHPRDGAAALAAYRAALAEWRASSGPPMPVRPPCPVAAMAVGAAVIVLALAVAAALGLGTAGCSGPDPSPGGTCVIGCSAVCEEGAETAACKTCVEGCEE